MKELDEKCYHMTSHLSEIINDKKLKPFMGDNSRYVNDKKLGLSYSVGLEGIIATNAMFRARYQYTLLENQLDREITLDDMFEQNVEEQENQFIGNNVYLSFKNTEQLRQENSSKDIADPKTKLSIDIDNIKGIILKSEDREKHDIQAIVKYATTKVDIEDVLEWLVADDKPFMNMEGYAKTAFSFREYVQRYYQELQKDSETLEIKNCGYNLEEIDVNELEKLVRRKVST